MPDLDMLLPSFPELYESIGDHLRGLLVCMLRCDPALRCKIDEAKDVVARLFDDVGIRPPRIFNQASFQIPDHASGVTAEDQQNDRPGIAELIGDDTRVRVRNVSEYLFPLIHADLMKGSLSTFRLEVDGGRLPGHVVDALNTSLPPTVGAWHKYDTSLVETSRFEIVAVRYMKDYGGGRLGGEMKEFSISALREQPDMMGEAEKVAASNSNTQPFWVHFRIHSTPLTKLMRGDRDFMQITHEPQNRKRGQPTGAE